MKDIFLKLDFEIGELQHTLYLKLTINVGRIYIVVIPNSFVLVPSLP